MIESILKINYNVNFNDLIWKKNIIEIVIRINIFYY